MTWKEQQSPENEEEYDSCPECGANESLVHNDGDTHCTECDYIHSDY